MYQNLMYGVKRRILREVEEAFLNHPAFSEKVIVKNKFPYEERPQYGVILRNTSASLMRMSADNYMADLKSHVRLATDKNNPGVAIEWVRENTNDITKYIENEDVSSQVDPTNRLFYTAHPIVSGPAETEYAVSSGQIVVTVNNLVAQVESVDGKKGQFILSGCPSSGSLIKVSYWYRTIAPPGLYYVDFTEDTEFYIDPAYVINKEVLFEKTTGLETTVSLAHGTIVPTSEEIIMKYANSESVIILVPGTDYTINNVNGEISFQHPIESGYQMLADYRYRPFADPLGPFKIEEYQENHDAIKGVVLCVGRRAKKGDRQVIVVTEFRESQASIYGGHWDMAISLGVISRDARQMEEMTDQVVNWLWAVRKNLMEFEGITLSRIEPTGESEETFIESTGDLYYESSVDLSVMTEWQQFVPHMYILKHFSMDTGLVTDTRPVIKYPAVGYERVL
jgi:hypothetical protein